MGVPRLGSRSSSRSRLGLYVAAALLVSGCARRSEQATRSAWEEALRRGRGASGERGPNSGAAGATARELAEWRSLREDLEEVAEQLADGAPTIDFDGLAERLCGAPPARERGPSVRTYHCAPATPVEISGTSLTIELDSSGVVAWTATGLDVELSDALLQRALSQLASACAQSWTPVQRAENAFQEFFTCPLEGGAVLAIGRVQSDKQEGEWQVSLALLGPG
ncbi:MAG: hypothetical protein IPK80_09860 [Nannocystis sp.]|nr:hypothetical protein [Nannocystis sp.]